MVGTQGSHVATNRASFCHPKDLGCRLPAKLQFRCCPATAGEQCVGKDEVPKKNCDSDGLARPTCTADGPVTTTTTAPRATCPQPLPSKKACKLLCVSHNLAFRKYKAGPNAAGCEGTCKCKPLPTTQPPTAATDPSECPPGSLDVTSKCNAACKAAGRGAGAFVQKTGCPRACVCSK